MEGKQLFAEKTLYHRRATERGEMVISLDWKPHFFQAQACNEEAISSSSKTMGVRHNALKSELTSSASGGELLVVNDVHILVVITEIEGAAVACDAGCTGMHCASLHHILQ